MTTALHLIDAFTDEPFRGNPAAVALLADDRTDDWMQSIAMEMNQAETAFLRLREDGFALRWFTPMAEVDLCGHATLASAHYLWSEGLLGLTDIARFHTRSGVLTARRDADGWITIDLPAIEPREVVVPDDLLAVLGVTPTRVFGGAFDLLCVVDDQGVVERLGPDLHAMARWDVRGVIVTAPSDEHGVDFISRCFYPALGIPEDPVTGSAHCALAPYWHRVTGRDTLVGRQASRRGGLVRCTVVNDRVLLAGKAVTTLVGELVR